MEDTICAISTSLSIGAISIIRVSGPKAIFYVDSIFSGDLKNAKTHTITYGHIKYKNEVIDETELDDGYIEEEELGDDMLLDGMDGILDDDEVLIDDTDLGEDNLLNDQDILDE